MSKSRLGKGLGALIPGPSEEEESRLIPLNQIQPNPYQPRNEFDEESLGELAQSIKEHGVIQPIILKQIDGGQYQIVVGERRWRASQKAGKENIPALIRSFTDRQMMEVALIENLQRQDLTPIEEAKAYKALITEFGLTQQEVARYIGKSRPAVANTLRLLALSPLVQDYVSRGTISMGHARALLSLPDRRSQEDAAKKIVAGSLNVRQTEKLVQDWGRGQKKKTILNYKTTTIKDWEEGLCDTLGTKVSIQPQSHERGVLQIEYRSLKELENIYALLEKGE